MSGNSNSPPSILIAYSVVFDTLVYSMDDPNDNSISPYKLIYCNVYGYELYEFHVIEKQYDYLLGLTFL